jgi:hypothetical protein
MTIKCDSSQDTWSRPSDPKQRPSDSSFTLRLKTADIYKQDSQGSTPGIEILRYCGYRHISVVVHCIGYLT